MRWYLPALACAAALVGRTQTPQSLNLADILSFETEHPGGAPGGWNVTPPGGTKVDSEMVHGGKWSARIERPANAAGNLTGILKSVPIEFTGARLEMRGFLRTKDVTGFVGMWMREDGERPSLAFDNMQNRQLKGTNDWQEYSITIPVNEEATQLFFGVFVTGTGTAWADDLKLLVDGKPIWEAKHREIPKTILDDDHEFDKGSGISLPTLTSVQIDNLVTLGKVWGFLKYHHPVITQGQRHWDYDLFRVLPPVLAASDRSSANAVILKWIGGLGELRPCKTGAKLVTDDLYMRPALEWLDDSARLGPELSAALHTVYANRPADGKQFYMNLARGVGNPELHHELSYSLAARTDFGFRILAAYRFWNIIEYWYPNRDLLGGKWDDALRECIPRITLTKSADDYQRELMALIGKIQDTHANLWSSMNVRPPTGDCRMAVNLRFVEDVPVVTDYAAAEAGKATGLERGDIITEIDGIPVSKLIEQWAPYYADSNGAARLRDMSRQMTRGACGETTVRIRHGAEERKLTLQRIVPAGLNSSSSNTHDMPGDTFRRLSPEIAYLKLSSIKIADVPKYIDAAAGSKGLIIDIRNYPSEFVVFALGQLLVDKPAPFAQFTRGDLSNPGAFHWDAQPTTLTPQSPHYAGKVIVLVDEISQSQAEYTAMAFRASGAKIIGSTTAGADGNVSQIPLPGGLNTMISGIGVFYPDHKPTQRIGILPDVEVHPSIAGIREGQDEVLARAVREILGPETRIQTIQQIVKQ